MEHISFGEVKRVILFGGARLLAETAWWLKDQGKYEVVVFSSQRHLEESVTDDGVLLKDFLGQAQVSYFCEEDINQSQEIDPFIDQFTLGIAFGAAWIFEKDFVQKFNYPLLDFMGIDLPRYRGGAHYTWQILFKNKKGCCNLQIILGGQESFHKGSILKRKEYQLDKECRLPIDYFSSAVPVERDFIVEFLKEVEEGGSFVLEQLEESESSYYPFLQTFRNGWIDWSWTAEEIECFICAFDDPYLGASSRVNGKRVFLKKVFLEQSDSTLHPFSAGLVMRKEYGCLRVLAKGGILRVGALFDKDGNNILSEICCGQRFYSPLEDIESSFLFSAEYDAKGLKL